MRWVMTYIESLARYEFPECFLLILSCIDTWEVSEFVRCSLLVFIFDCRHTVGWSDALRIATICMSAPKHVRTRRVPPRLSEPSSLSSATRLNSRFLGASSSIDFVLPSAMISALVLVTAIVVALSPGPVIGAITSGLQAILMNTHGSKDYDYPTDLTRDIYPVSYVLFRSQLSITAALCDRSWCLARTWLTTSLDPCSLS